jgi:rhodanese-related sulfurtransferase
MSLPKTVSVKTSLPGKKIDGLILPALVIFVVAGILVAGFLIRQQKDKPKSSRDTSLYTEPTTIKNSEGKTVGVPARVQQISPEALKAQIEAKEEIVILHIYEGEEWQEPHIKGTLFYKKSDLKFSPALSPEKKYVFVSKDGYEGALALHNFIQHGFPWEKNFNLEGGLEAWKKKGYPLEI